jgi:hypothetical protein
MCTSVNLVCGQGEGLTFPHTPVLLAVPHTPVLANNPEGAQHREQQGHAPQASATILVDNVTLPSQHRHAARGVFTATRAHALSAHAPSTQHQHNTQMPPLQHLYLILLRIVECTYQGTTPDSKLLSHVPQEPPLPSHRPSSAAKKLLKGAKKAARAALRFGCCTGGAPAGHPSQLLQECKVCRWGPDTSHLPADRTECHPVRHC